MYARPVAAAAIAAAGFFGATPAAHRTHDDPIIGKAAFGLTMIASGDAILATDRSSGSAPGTIRTYRRAMGNGARWTEVAKRDGPGRSGQCKDLVRRPRCRCNNPPRRHHRPTAAAALSSSYRKERQHLDACWTASWLGGGSAARAGFGCAVIALAGDFAFVGARAPKGIGGMVHVFHRDGSGNWQDAGTLTSTTDETSAE